MAPKASSSQPKPIKEEPDAKDNAAMDLIAGWARDGTAKRFPSALKDWLKNTDNKLLVEIAPSATAQVLPFEVSFANERIKVKSLAAGTSIVGNARRFNAFVVKMIERQAGGAAIQRFEAGQYVTVDLSAPSAPVVATVQLQGCSFVIGFDKNNKNLLHLGHAQPAGGQVADPSVKLKEHFEKADLNTIFEGQQLKKVKVLGGYTGAVIVRLLGWVTAGKLFLALKTDKEVTIKEYP